MGQTDRTGEYSIAAVSKLTGIGCHALRVWERRYGFPVPRRSPSGHRRYGADQVGILRRVAQRMARGEALAELMGEVRSGLMVPESDGPATPPLAPALLALIDRLQAGDIPGAEGAYRDAAAGLSDLERVRSVLAPALVEVGERWFRGECDVFQEHTASGFLRMKIALLGESIRAANLRPRKTAVVGTVQGDRHEGGVLMVGLMLESAGWRVLSLGVDLPVREFQKAVDLWKPDAVCISFVLSRNINKRFDELARLRGAPVYVGGRSIVNYQGLARKHGLRPLVGPAEEAVRKLIVEVESGSRPGTGAEA